MAQFQSQGQWENEVQNTLEPLADGGIIQQEETPNRQKLPYSKILLVIVLLFTVTATGIVAAYMRGRSIEGIWVRQADDNYGAEGMTVEVTKNGSTYEGKVIRGSDDSSKFREGQIKWFQLKKVGFGVYEGYNLCEDEDTQTFFYTEDISVWTIQSGGKALSIESVDDSPGAHQLWIKEKRNN